MRKVTTTLIFIGSLLVSACAGTGASRDGAKTSDPPPQSEPSGNVTDPAGGASEPPVNSTDPGGWTLDDPVHPWETDVQIGPARVAVLQVIPDAWPELQASTDIAAPEPGLQYVVASMVLTNTSSDTIHPAMNYSIGYTAADGTFYGRAEKFLEDQCWNVPNNLWEHETGVLAGHSLKFNVCMPVPAEAISGGVIEVSWMVPGELDGGFFAGLR